MILHYSSSPYINESSVLLISGIYCSEQRNNFIELGFFFFPTEQITMTVCQKKMLQVKLVLLGFFLSAFACCTLI